MSQSSTKTDPTPKIKAIRIGNTDESGNLITDVLASGNEYAIYEVKTDDINKKLRFQIDGINDDSEKGIIESYVKVKEKYIIAKGLLYRTANAGVMKNRVAHALATAFSLHTDEALGQFERLIKDINDEYKQSYVKRVFYSLPGYLVLISFTIYYLYLKKISGTCDINDWIKILWMAAIGGVFSMTFNLKNIRFDTEVRSWIYCVYGVERILLALLSGIVGAIGIKSKFIFGNISDGAENSWSLLFLVILSGLSEKMIPSIITKYEQKI